MLEGREIDVKNLDKELEGIRQEIIQEIEN